MLYLLGGAARSGKSIIAQQILTKRGIPFFCLDHLAQAAARTIPQLQIDLDSDDRNVGERIWPLVKAVAAMLIKDKIDYLLEGASLQPQHAYELHVEYPGDVRSIFIGYAQAEIFEKLKAVKQYGGGPDDWMQKFDDEVIRHELERLKTVSETLREDCRRYQLKYVEMSSDFDKSVKEVIEYMVN